VQGSNAIQIGNLCVSGDLACTFGDLAGFRAIVEQLAECVPEPLHCELATLREVCKTNPARALESWPPLRDRLYREAGR
jgi:hypothetical protein